MDSLLSRATTIGGGLLTMLDRLGTANVMRDPGMDELAGGPGTDIAAEAARRAGLAAMLQPGLPWQAMIAARDAAGQQTYNDSIMAGAQRAEAVRKAREDKKRRESIASWLGGVKASVGQEGSPFNASQVAALETMDTDTLAKIQQTTMFPQLNSSGNATAGSIVAVKRGPNGNILAVVQTGDPSSPVAVQDTGVQTEAELPSQVRAALFNRSNPGVIPQLNYDTDRAGAEGKAAAEANAVAYNTLPSLISDSRNHLASLQSLRDQLAALPTGPIAGPVLAKLDSDFQVALASAREEALFNIAALKAAGVSLTPITERELEILFSTSAKLENNADANVRIIDQKIRRIQRVIETAQRQLDWLDGGNDIQRYRPPRDSAAPAAEPAPTPTAAPQRRTVLPPEQRQVGGI